MTENVVHNLKENSCGKRCQGIADLVLWGVGCDCDDNGACPKRIFPYSISCLILMHIERLQEAESDVVS